MTKVFISYAHEDLDAARRLYDELRAVPGVVPWFDKEDLSPGLEWRPAIRKAIREADFFLALLSKMSTSKRGYVQKEMKEALEVRDEFPEGRAYLIPIRLDDCRPSYESLGDIQHEDFFPDWGRGLERVLKVIKSIPDADAGGRGDDATGYEYRCAVVDFDNGLTNLPQMCRRLNSVQGFFHFTHPDLSLRHKALRRFDDTPNLFIPALPRTLYEQKAEYLNADLVACLTKHLLAFEEDDELLYNYLSGPSSVDDTFLFISTNELYAAAKGAGCTFEKAVVYNILSQLIVYFAKDLGFHDKIRGCVLDFCTDRSVMVKGLKAMRLCKRCLKKVKNVRMKEAAQAILVDTMRV
jgi:hypothetical protein